MRIIRASLAAFAPALALSSLALSPRPAAAQDVSQASPAKWTNESEVGLVVTGGNSRSQSYNLKQMTSHETHGNIYKLNARYLKTTSGDVESARNWSLGLRYERTLSERVNAYAGLSLDSDRFAGFLQRYNADLGAKYYFIKAKEAASPGSVDWFAELGYRYTAEHRVASADLNSHFARLYTEATRTFTESVSARGWVEALPSFTLSEDYQVNAELSLSAAVSSIFSVKSAYLVKFDNLPAPGVAFKTDTQLTTSLVAKF